MDYSAFESYLFLKGRKITTIKNHIKSLIVLERELKNWKIEGVDEFLTKRIRRGARNATINHYIDTIRLYAAYSGLYDLKDYKHLKKQNSLKSVLSDEEIEAFLNLPPAGRFKHSHKVWTLFFKLLAFTGMRCGELGKMTTDCVDFGRMTFLVLDTKTGVPRQVPIPTNCVDGLKEHLENLGDKGLFTTMRGKPFSDHAWGHAFKQRIKRLKINRPNLTPYSFRHSFATALLEEDVNIHKIAKILGHDIKMTAQYEHLTVRDVQQAIKRHPLIKKTLTPTSDEIYSELERVLKTYNLRFDISKSDKEVKLSVFLR